MPFVSLQKSGEVLNENHPWEQALRSAVIANHAPFTHSMTRQHTWDTKKSGAPIKLYDSFVAMHNNGRRISSNHFECGYSPLLIP